MCEELSAKFLIRREKLFNVPVIKSRNFGKNIIYLALSTKRTKLQCEVRLVNEQQIMATLVIEQVFQCCCNILSEPVKGMSDVVAADDARWQHRHVPAAYGRCANNKLLSSFNNLLSNFCQFNE